MPVTDAENIVKGNPERGPDSFVDPFGESMRHKIMK